MDRIKNIVIVLLAVVCAVLAGLNIKQSASQHTARGSVCADTTKDTIYDTLKIIMPVPRDSLVVRYVTERLPVRRDSARLANEAGNADSGMDAGSKNGTDSVDVAIPVSVKEYRGDGYHAWVSGYRPSLDSIHVFPRHEITTITKTSKPKRWSIGIQAGYGITPAGFQPYLGVGVTCNLFRF